MSTNVDRQAGGLSHRGTGGLAGRILSACRDSPHAMHRIAEANLTSGAWTTNLTLGMISPDAGTTTTRTLTEPAASNRFYRVQAIVPLSP